MGNATSNSTPYEWSIQMRKEDLYNRLCNRASNLNLMLTVQGDGSIQIQDQDNLVNGNNTISAPKSEADITRAITEINKILETYEQNKGFVHHGYQ